MKYINLVFIIILSVNGSIYSQNTGTPRNQENIKSEVLVNRRVLILDFVNAKNAADYSYLEESIPDSFADPLSRTKSFELLDASEWHNLVDEKKFSKQDAWREKMAIEAGKLAGADVVIIGKFVAFDDHMEIFTKAIELSSSRVMVSRNITAPLDNTMFVSIKKLTEDMSAEMKEKLPPLPQKVITEERIKYVEKSNIVAAEADFIWAHKKISIGLNPGFFVNLDPVLGASGPCGTCEMQIGLIGRFWVFHGLYFGAKLDFGELWSPVKPLGDSPVLDVFALMGYGLPLDRWLISADIGAGYFFIYDKFKGLEYNPAFGARVGLEFLIIPVFSIGLNANVHMYYDIPKPLLFGGLALSFNYVI